MSLIKLFLGGNNLVFSRPEIVWSVTSRLGTGKWLTLFYSVGERDEQDITFGKYLNGNDKDKKMKRRERERKEDQKKEEKEEWEGNKRGR
jgi:hypothetical protein